MNTTSRFLTDTALYSLLIILLSIFGLSSGIAEANDCHHTHQEEIICHQR